MLGIGFGEMILIAGIALMVFGPEKFPDFAKIVLRTVNDLRGYVDEIQKEVTKEIRPIKRELEQMSKYDPEKYIDALSKDITDATNKKVETEKKEDVVSTGNEGDDSSEVSTDSSESSQEDSYMESNMDNNLTEDGYDSADSVPETGENQDCQTDADSVPETGENQDCQSDADSVPEAGENQDCQTDAGNANTEEEDDVLDFSNPPVERLD